MDLAINCYKLVEWAQIVTTVFTYLATLTHDITVIRIALNPIDRVQLVYARCRIESLSIQSFLIDYK